ncbi:cytochrome P450 [Panus rudis PR-1116 ss-1]|nr:cytochrome P450 [Panus rudis PR-1116 ss-1]
MSSLLNIAAYLLSLSVPLWLYVYRLRSRKGPLPPGPPGLPFVGNILDLQYLQSSDMLAQWAKEYDSDLIYFEIMGTKVVVINSLSVAEDLFSKRSAIYNDRPEAPMTNQLVGFKWGLSQVPYGEEWRTMRRAFHQVFNQNAVKEYRPFVLEANRGLLKRLLTGPDRFVEHLRHTSGRVIMRTAYGIDIAPENDPFIEIAENAMQGFSAVAKGHPVDFFPILQYIPSWFPGVDFKREAAKWRPYADAMLEKPYEWFKKQFANEESAPKCAGSDLLECSFVQNATDPVWMDTMVKQTLASMYGAGSDTTVSSMMSFFLAMTLYPDVQKKAQEEIDNVIGTGRLPEFSDIASLPYVGAIVDETLRWHPVLPISLYHSLQEDDFYNGYFLPKGAVCIGNVGPMLHDEAQYPQPYVFRPERYFNENGQRDPNVLDPANAAFGFGRRVCPGRHLARDTLSINIATILSAFDITKALDEFGREIVPREEYTNGMLTFPKAFQCKIKPRSPAHEEMIRAASKD